MPRAAHAPLGPSEAEEVAGWALTLAETFGAASAAAEALREDIRTGRRNQYGQTAKSIIRATKHIGDRSRFQCPTCRTIHSRVGQCAGCQRSYAK